MCHRYNPPLGAPLMSKRSMTASLCTAAVRQQRYSNTVKSVNCKKIIVEIYFTISSIFTPGVQLSSLISHRYYLVIYFCIYDILQYLLLSLPCQLQCACIFSTTERPVIQKHCRCKCWLQLKAVHWQFIDTVTRSWLSLFR